MERPQTHATPVSYEGREYRCVPVNAQDAALIDALLRESPMQGWVRLRFSLGERPDAVSQPSADTRHIILIQEKRSPGRIAGLYALQAFPVYLDGRACRAVYLSFLRIRPEFRRRIAVLRDGYAAIPHFAAALGFPDDYFTSIAADNLPARRLLEADLRQLPRYTLQGEMRTLAFSTSLGKDYGLLQPATETDREELAAFYSRHAGFCQYAPVLDQECLYGGGLGFPEFFFLRQNGVLAACLALWDRRDAHGITVDGYRAPLNWLRPAYNLYARCRGLPVLPKPGDDLHSIFISFAAFAPEALPLAGRCLREALYIARSRDHASTALMGVSPANPLCGLLEALPHHVYETRIHSVDWRKDDPALRYSGLVQPEIALL